MTAQLDRTLTFTLALTFSLSLAPKRKIHAWLRLTRCGPCRMIGPHFETLAAEFPWCTFVKVKARIRVRVLGLGVRVRVRC